MFNWIKSLFVKKPITDVLTKVGNKIYLNGKFLYTEKSISNIEKPKKRPRLYKQATVVTTGELPKPKEKKMPLKKGTSNATRQKNIATEIKAGKKSAQAVAIGYAVQKEAKAKAKPAAKGKK